VLNGVAATTADTEAEFSCAFIFVETKRNEVKSTINPTERNTVCRICTKCLSTMTGFSGICVTKICSSISNGVSEETHIGSISNAGTGAEARTLFFDIFFFVGACFFGGIGSKR